MRGWVRLPLSPLRAFFLQRGAQAHAPMWMSFHPQRHLVAHVHRSLSRLGECSFDVLRVPSLADPSSFHYSCTYYGQKNICVNVFTHALSMAILSAVGEQQLANEKSPQVLKHSRAH